jgi:membrane protein implicated in regulation of membrane protease activity
MLLPFAIWLIAGAVLIGLEMLTGAFVALSFGLGCFGVALVEFLSGEASMIRDLLVFGVLTIVSIVALRWMFGRKNGQHVAKADINRY